MVEDLLPATTESQYATAVAANDAGSAVGYLKRPGQSYEGQLWTLVNEPLVLLADEPTGNLDERATRSIFQLLKDINAMGTTVVMATHDVALIGRSRLRFIELEQGSVVHDGHDLERLAADAQRWK